MGDAFSYPLGDFDDAGLSLNGGAAISDQSYSNQLQLTDGGANESHSAFTEQQFNVSSFATNFNVQFSGPSTSGFAFVLQGSGDAAVGTGNAGAGGIAKSVAVEFLATTSGTETELSVNGVATTPVLLTPSSIDLSNGQVILVSIEYDGSTLQVTETESQTTLTPIPSTQTYSNVNIPSATGGQAYLGFTGSDGSSGVTQVIQSWEFADNPPTDTDIGSPVAAGSSSYSVGGQYAVHGADRRGIDFGSVPFRIRTDHGRYDDDRAAFRAAGRRRDRRVDAAWGYHRRRGVCRSGHDRRRRAIHLAIQCRRRRQRERDPFRLGSTMARIWCATAQPSADTFPPAPAARGRWSAPRRWSARPMR